MDSSCADHSIPDCSSFESTRDRPVRKRVLKRARFDEQEENFPFEPAKNVPRGPVRKRILSRARCDEQEENFPFGPANNLSGNDEKSPSLLGLGHAK
jgi:hypothetical protein